MWGYIQMSKVARGVRSPEAGVKGVYKPPDVCWELNLGPVQELLFTTEQSLQLKLFG